MINLIEKYPRWAVILTLTLMLGLAFPHVEVSIMEARDFITAREMITDGNWLLTTMNGEARYEKPPLPTWMSAISGSIFGENSIIAMRLPGLLMAIILSLGFFEVLKHFIPERDQRIMGTFILITSLYVLVIIFEAPWDIYTHGFALLSILFYTRLFQGNAHWKPAVAAGVFLGLSILSKGPIGLYALWLPFMISYLIIFKASGLKGKWLLIGVSLVIAVITGGWWFYYVRIADPETFLAIASRETENWSSYNLRPFYYYWDFFVQSGLWTIPSLIALLYPYLKNRVNNRNSYLFSLYWTISALILLSIIPEKKSRYLMPVLIPLAMNTSFYIEYLRTRLKELKDSRELAPVIFHFMILSLVGISFGIVVWLMFETIVIQHPLRFALMSFILLLIGIFIIHGLRQRNFTRLFYSSVLLYIVLFSLGSGLISNDSEGYRPISGLQEELEARGLKLYGPVSLAPEIIWQYGGKIPEIIQEDGSVNLPEADSFALLSSSSDFTKDDKLNSDFKIRKGPEYDLNKVDSSSRRYKERLHVQLFYFDKRR